MITGSDAYYQVGVILRDLAWDSLSTSPAGQPAVKCVVPGAIAWDTCDTECGQLSVSLTRLFLTDTFPNQSVLDTPCAAGELVGEYLVQIIRCAPLPQGDSTTVPCARLEQAALVNVVDAKLVLNGVTCGLTELKDDRVIADYAIGPSVTRGPDGGCVGSELLVQVSLIRTNDAS